RPMRPGRCAMRLSSSAGSLIQWGTASWSNGDGAAYRAQARSGKCPAPPRRPYPCHDPGRWRNLAAGFSRKPGLREVCRIVVMALLLAGCTRNPGEPARDERSGAAGQAHEGIVTISGDDSILESLTWRAPAVGIPPDGVADALERAGQALDAGNLATDAESAVPLFLALSKQAPDDPRVRAGLQRALQAVVARGDEALSRAGDDISALRRAHQMAAVARAVDS